MAQRELPPPLEMMCLNALWQISEGTVEDVRVLISRDKPLAYTTVLTLLDRLTKRGSVTRRKEGRGFRYTPAVDRNKLRALAVQHVVDFHFDGSAIQLKEFLGPTEERPLVRAAAASGARPADSEA